jgi:hypothetical protein
MFRSAKPGDDVNAIAQHRGRRVLNRLAGDERGKTELALKFSPDQPVVLEHLIMLHKTSILVLRRLIIPLN